MTDFGGRWGRGRLCVSSHLHAWPDGESVREAEPDAASGRLPGCCAQLFSSQLGSGFSSTISPRGPGANDVPELAAAEQGPLTRQQAEAGREQSGTQKTHWYPLPHPPMASGL